MVIKIEKIYHNNGLLKYEIPYINGKRNGYTKVYDIFGDIITQINCIDDKVTGLQMWFYYTKLSELNYLNNRFKYGIKLLCYNFNLNIQ